MKRFAVRMGFTLVEMLITIAVMVTLISMMMLSSTEGGASADAAKILADMATIKRAAIQWYSDNRQVLKAMYSGRITRTNINESPDIIQGIEKYIDGSVKLKLNENTNPKGSLKKGGYGVCDVTNHRTTWYVGYKFANDENAVKEKIKGRAKLLGLHFSAEWPNPGNIAPKIASGDATVWMHILGDLSDTSSWTN